VRYKESRNGKDAQKMNSKIKLECPICITAASFVFTSKLSRNIYECSNGDCGHFFTPPFTNEQGICARDENLEKESDESIGIFDERNGRLLKLLTDLLNIQDYPATFMDFGAGNAHISRTFKRVLGDKVKIYCLEPNPACKDLYQKYGLLRLSTLSDLPEKIDLVYMIEVIEHLDNPVATMSLLSQHLKENGAIFLSTPIGRRQENTTNAYDTPSHLHFFTEKSLNLTLKKSGFSEISFKYYAEMYPLPLQGILHRAKAAIRKLIKRIILLIRPNSNQIGHLVGLTKSIR
jgi:hypothetical protein